MDITSVGPQTTIPSPPETVPDPLPEEPPAPTAEPPSSQESETPDKEPGVLRLLKQGHFNPVADLRHRIKYAEELEALAAAESQAAATAPANALIDAVVGALGGLPTPAPTEEPDPAAAVAEAEPEAEPSDLVAGLQLQFTQAVNDALAGGYPDGGLVKGIEEAFAQLLTSLREAFPPAPDPVEPPPAEPEAIIQIDPPVEPGPLAPEPPQEPPVEPEAVIQTDPPVEPEAIVPPPEPQAVEPPPAPEEPAEPSFGLEAFIEDLKVTFNAALEQLAAALNSISVLPELSPPKGNGVAYEKFLAIYEGLNAPAPDTEPVDATG